jgi:hypothetical protein
MKAQLPLPLEAKRLDHDHSVIYDANGRVVVRSMITEDHGIEAEWIVACVNAHDELVAALKSCVESAYFRDTPAIRVAAALLARLKS